MAKVTRTPKARHFARPYGKWLAALARDKQFQGMLATLREKWQIPAGTDPDGFWRSIVEQDDSRTEEYPDRYEHEQTAHQLLKKDMSELGKYAGLSSDEWWIMLHVAATGLDWTKIPMPRTMGRIDVMELNRHLFLDVTWAGKDDVEEYWAVVRNWQEKTRPTYVKRGQLPNLLKDIKAGRPERDDEMATQCARWKEAGKTYREIRELVKQKYGIEWALTEGGLNRSGTVYYTCATAKNYVKRGRQLLKQLGK